MTKDTLTRIVDKMEEIYKEDKIMQEGFKVYCKIISPDTHSPVYEHRQLDGIMEAIRIIHPHLVEWFEYYFYEAKNMKDDATATLGDKKYNCKNKDEFIQLILDYDENYRKEEAKKQ